jgi:ABC-type Fe3+-hydroxamate transport system substrate-binding protein
VAKGFEIGEEDLTDAAGVSHTAASADARIVSLVPSITELLFDLGLGDQIVGRTAYCVHPEAAVDGVAVVGATKKLDLQALRACRPSHVVVNIDENTREMVEQIRQLGLTLVVTHPLAPLDNLALYRLLGGLFNASTSADRLALAFNRALHRLLNAAQTLPPRKVLYLIWRQPWMTVSRATYIARTLALVNWTTLASSETARYPILLDPGKLIGQADLVLLSSEPFPFERKHVDELRARCTNSRTKFALCDAEMVSWYGSRAITGLDYLRKYALSLQS